MAKPKLEDVRYVCVMDLEDARPVYLGRNHATAAGALTKGRTFAAGPTPEAAYDGAIRYTVATWRTQVCVVMP